MISTTGKRKRDSLSSIYPIRTSEKAGVSLFAKSHGTGNDFAPRSHSAAQPKSSGTIIPQISPNKLDESEKRRLRSKNGGSRSKSELSLYFPNYEDLISNEPKEAGKEAKVANSTDH